MIRLGLIGLSEGNGHPYSWGAIFNGYNKTLMKDCGFKSIPDYLEKEIFPNVQIKNAKVTHVWTQSIKLSEKIAKTVFIQNVVDDFNSMIGSIDALLLARDDANNHYELALPFLKAGIPIYIDKPIAFSINEAKKIFAAQSYPGQIFSCSALAFSKDLQLSETQKNKIGKIIKVIGHGPKCWNKYSIHLIEPALNLIPDRGEIIKSSSNKISGKVNLTVNFANDVLFDVTTHGVDATPFQLQVIGETGKVSLRFDDTFDAFKQTLEYFISGIQTKTMYISTTKMLEVVELIELGQNYE